MNSLKHCWLESCSKQTFLNIYTVISGLEAKKKNVNISTQTADSRCNTFSRYTRSHSCSYEKLHLAISSQIFKQEGIV